MLGILNTIRTPLVNSNIRIHKIETADIIAKDNDEFPTISIIKIFSEVIKTQQQ